MVKRINVTIAKVSMIIKGYECGPGVPKFLVQLTHKVSGVIADKLLVGTAGKDRQISRVYLSDDKGQEVSSASEYLVIQMPVTFDSQKNTAVACPFYYNLETLHNTWVEDYPVTIKGLEVFLVVKWLNYLELLILSITVYRRILITLISVAFILALILIH
mgnify:CR=1 FL=1